MSKFTRTIGLGRGHIILVSLTASLFAGVSHNAMAACVTNGSRYDCTDTSTIPADKTLDFSTTGTSASDGNYTVKVLATPATDGTAILDNAKTISATLSTLSSTNTLFRVYGMKGADAFGIEEWELTNTGAISASHKGLGETAAIYLQDDAEAFSITNSGTIAVTRGALTNITSNSTSGAITARDSFGNTGTLGVAAGIYNNEEEIRDHNVINNAGASITATGQYSAAIFTRSNSFELVNNGTINGYEVAPSSGNPAGTMGTAAAIVTWDGRLLKNFPDAELSNCTAPNVCTAREAGFGKSFIENNGTINGNVIITGLNGLQVLGRIGTGADPITLNGANGAVPNVNVSGGMVDRRDSEFTNSGTIVGNFYYGNGAHVLQNQGSITGDIIVDQRRVTNYLDANNYSASSSAKNPNPYQVYVAGRSAAFGDADDGDGDEEGETGAPKIYTSDPGLSYADALANAAAKLVADNPDRHFTFDNAGVFDGNLSVLTVNNTYTNAALLAGAVPQVKITPQTVDIKTHITGSGTASSLADPSLGSGYISKQLFIGNGSMAGWTVNPVASTISADGAGGTTKTTVTPVIDHVVHDGEWFMIAKQLFGDALPGVAGETALVSWDIAKNASGSLVVGASVADAATIAGISRPGAAAINALIATDGSDENLNALAAGVQSLEDAGDVRKAGEQLKPETNYATQQAAITLNSAIGQHIDTRLASVGATGSFGSYAAPSGLGMKTQQGDPNRMSLGGSLKDDGEYVQPRGTALWGQAFGAGMNQNERSNVDGYDARLYGVLVGYDNWIAPNLRLGVAGGYANTHIDGEGDTSANQTDIDSYLFEAYGAYKGDGWYASGRTGFTWHGYDTTRVLTQPFTDSAKGNHDGDQFNIAIEVGAPMKVAGAIVTPVGGVTYSLLHQDSYTETSGAMGLTVDSQNNDSIVSSLGVKGLMPIADDTVIEGRALWLHEFGDDSQVVNASFAAGGGTFTAAGPGVGRDTAALGIGMLAQIGWNSTFELNYDANVREDYLAHIGSARLDVHF